MSKNVVIQGLPRRPRDTDRRSFDGRLLCQTDIGAGLLMRELNNVFGGFLPGVDRAAGAIIEDPGIDQATCEPDRSSSRPSRTLPSGALV